MTNFIVIIADDMRADHLDDMPLTLSMGHKFPNGFVANPVCCASRVSTLTGRHSRTTQIYGNNYPIGGFTRWVELDGEKDTIAPKLRDAGYATGLFGKYINEYNQEDTAHVPDGWTEFMGITTGGGAYYNTKFSQNGTEYVMEPGVYLTDFIAERGRDFITRHKDEPFFLWLSPVAPHKDHVPAPRHQDAFPDLPAWRPPSFDEVNITDKPKAYQVARLTDEEITEIDTNYPLMKRTLLALDELVQSIVDSLIENGIDDDTVVFFMSDNGFQFGEHRQYGKSVPYLESTRMPFVVRWHGGTPNANALVQNIDIIPTIAELAGVVDDGFDGKSLVSELNGGPSREFVYTEHHRFGQKPAWAQAQKKNRTYTWHDTGEEEWYNIQQDPWQRENKLFTAPGSINADDIEAARQFVRDELDKGMPPGMTTKP